jgi:hypothetical protein
MEGKIRLAYRVVIDQKSNSVWDQYVHQDTFKEYLMQQQLYNSNENPSLTFRELLSVNDKAEALHYLVGMAAKSYVTQLKGKWHRVTDVLGNNYFPFEHYALDIVNTHIADSSRHKIGITFFSPLLTLIATINDCYLVSTNTESEKGLNTIMFPMQPGLSICYFEPL